MELLDQEMLSRRWAELNPDEAKANNAGQITYEAVEPPTWSIDMGQFDRTLDAAFSDELKGAS